MRYLISNLDGLSVILKPSGSMSHLHVVLLDNQPTRQNCNQPYHNMLQFITTNVTSGPAGGKMMTKVVNDGSVVGYIQPTHVDFGPLGCTTVYIVCDKHGVFVMRNTLYDAFKALNVNIFVEGVELPEGVYCETQKELQTLKFQRRFKQ